MILIDCIIYLIVVIINFFTSKNFKYYIPIYGIYHILKEDPDGCWHYGLSQASQAISIGIICGIIHFIVTG